MNWIILHICISYILKKKKVMFAINAEDYFRSIGYGSIQCPFVCSVRRTRRTATEQFMKNIRKPWVKIQKFSKDKLMNNEL